MYMAIKEFLVLMVHSYLSKHAFKADEGRLSQAGTPDEIETNQTYDIANFRERFRSEISLNVVFSSESY